MNLLEIPFVSVVWLVITASIVKIQFLSLTQLVVRTLCFPSQGPFGIQCLLMIRDKFKSTDPTKRVSFQIKVLIYFPVSEPWTKPKTQILSTLVIPNLQTKGYVQKLLIHYLNARHLSLRHLTRRMSIAFWLLSEKRKFSGSHLSSMRSRLGQLLAMPSISWSTWMFTPSRSQVPIMMILQTTICLPILVAKN